MSEQGNPVAPGYIFVEMFITDPEKVRRYAALSGDLVRAAGGEYVALGAPVVLEGEHPPAKCALIRFPSAKAAADFYHSDGYQSARSRRQGGGQFRITLLEGRTSIAA